MKNILLIAVLVFGISQLFGQYSKGDKTLGISTTLSSVGTGPEMFGIGFSTTKANVGGSYSDPITNLSINFSPKLGYFVKDNFAIGTDINFSYKNISNENNKDADQKSLFTGLGVYARQYFSLSKIHAFMELDAGLGGGNVTYVTYNYSGGYDRYTSETHFYNFGATGGLSFSVSEMVAIDVAVGYDCILELPDFKFYDSHVRTQSHYVGFEVGLNVFINNKKN